MLCKKSMLFILLAWSNQLFSQNTQFGIATDFEQSPAIDSIFQIMIEEIDRTAGTGKNVTLSSDHIIYGTNSLEQASANYNSLSPQVDFMLLVGGVSIKGALINSPFLKPTIGVAVIDPELQEIPFQDNKSGVKNFSYIWSTREFDKELAQFAQLHAFDKLAILVDAASAITFNQQKGQVAIDSLSRLLSASIDIIPITDNISASLSTMPEDVDAVYVTDLYGKTPDDIQQIANELKIKKLPSFSGSKWHVDAGILGCISDENGLEEGIRKLAIMVDESLEGAPLSEMSVVINYREQFFLNLQTAREIDFSPPFKILFTATLIEEDETQFPTYSLDEIMQNALETNFDIKISYQDIEISEQDIRSARTAILPSLDLSVSGSQIKPKLANATLNQPERSLSGQLDLQQLLYSEKAIAGIKISHFIKKAQEYDTEADILSVLLDTYIGYFGVLAAKTDLLIQQENLNNSNTNLELAKIRVNVGSATNADVYRWESEVASAKQAVVNAQTTMLSAKLQLRTFLANSLEEEYDIEDITIDDEVYQEFVNAPMAQFVKTPKDLGLVTEFMVEEALNTNPNKMVLLENINAAEREQLQNRRLLYTPTLALQGQTAQVLDRGGKGSTAEPGIGFVDNSWQLGLALNYPLFQGNGRRVNLQKSKIQLEQLSYSRQQLDQNLELAVKNNVLQLLNTTTNIVFSQTASENARLNFELVQDNYRGGTINITQLIDAQRAALQARLGYALSVYDYLQAQLQLEFVIGSFSMFSDEDQLNDFQNRFLQFRSNN